MRTGNGARRAAGSEKVSTTSNTTTAVTATTTTRKTTSTTTTRTTTSTTTTPAGLELITIGDATCRRTFLLDELEVNPVTLADTDFLRGSQTVASVEECAIACCNDDLCCKAVLETDYTCKLYSYIKDGDVPFPQGATLIRDECCYNGELEMGEVTLHMSQTTRDDAETACNDDGEALVKPISQCAYDLILNLAKVKADAMPQDRFWIALRNPSGKDFVYDDGSVPEFQLELEPDGDLQNIQKLCMVFRRNGLWMIGDMTDTTTVSYMCQTNTL